MRLFVLAAGILALASCTTPEAAGPAMGGGQQQAATEREAPVPPALRSPRQRSAVGWPDIGYSPYRR